MNRLCPRCVGNVLFDGREHACLNCGWTPPPTADEPRNIALPQRDNASPGTSTGQYGAIARRAYYAERQRVHRAKAKAIK